MSNLLFWPLLALCLTSGGIWLALESGLARRLALDRPTGRSLHHEAIPRSGGALMFLAITACSLPVTGGLSWPIGLALLLAGVSLLDDRHSLPIFLRLIVQGACAMFCMLFLKPGGVMPIWIYPLLVLLLVWAINLFNFMDGANGLAGGAAVIGFGWLGWGMLSHGQNTDAVLCWIVALAAFGFLFFNIGTARIFMGDAGSIPLGFLAGWYGIWGWVNEVWSAAFPLLVFSPLVVDATLTLLKRIMRGEPFWHAHCEHAYQRLVRMGWSHGRAAGAYHAWMLTAGSGGLVLADADENRLHALYVCGWLGLTVAAYLWVEWRWIRHLRINDSTPRG